MIQPHVNAILDRLLTSDAESRVVNARQMLENALRRDNLQLVMDVAEGLVNRLQHAEAESVPVILQAIQLFGAVSGSALHRALIPVLFQPHVDPIRATRLCQAVTAVAPLLEEESRLRLLRSMIVIALAPNTPEGAAGEEARLALRRRDRTPQNAPPQLPAGTTSSCTALALRTPDEPGADGWMGPCDEFGNPQWD